MARLSKLSRSIAGKVALVTGAASGMGRATAFLLADEGARVAVVDIDGDGVAKAVDRIRNANCVAAGFVADLADAASLGPMVMAIRKELGPIDILINNAGVSAGGPFEGDGYEGEWRRAFAVNLDAEMHLIRLPAGPPALGRRPGCQHCEHGGAAGHSAHVALHREQTCRDRPHQRLGGGVGGIGRHFQRGLPWANSHWDDRGDSG